MSSPTTRSLYSLAMLVSSSSFSSAGVGAGRRRRPAAAPHSRRRGAGRRTPARPLRSARSPGSACATKRSRARQHFVVAAAAQLDHRAGVQLDAPASRGPTASSALDAPAPAARTAAAAAGTSPASAPTLPSGPAQRRQAVVLDVAEVGLEHLAEAVDQPRRRRRSPATGAPAGAPRSCTAQPVRADAAHDGLAHPGHAPRRPRAPRPGRR